MYVSEQFLYDRGAAMGLEFSTKKTYGFCALPKVCAKAKENFAAWAIDKRVIVNVYCLASENDKLPASVEVPEEIKTLEEG